MSKRRNKSAARETRDRNRPLLVYGTASERTEIERRARDAGMSVSRFLRDMGVAREIPARGDLAALQVLARINALVDRSYAFLEEARSGAIDLPTDPAYLDSLHATLDAVRARLVALVSRL